MTEAPANVGRKVAVGAAYMVVGRLAVRLISIVNILILARLLTPEDFGVVVLAAITISLLETLTAMNYAIALVRRPTVEPSLYDTAWTLTFLRGVLLAAVVSLTADFQASVFGDPRIAPLLHVIALGMILDGLQSIGLIRLQREMRFDVLFRYQVVIKLLAFVATQVLAFTLGNYWCLVLGNIVAKLIFVPYSYWLAPHRARVSFAHVRELFHFSKWMVVINAAQAVEIQAANLALGRIAGVHALGMYNVSYQLAAAPVTELAVPVRGPIYAGYAQVQDDAARLRAQFLGGFALLATLLAPLSVGIALVAPQLERLALGPNWAGAAPIIALIALAALVECLCQFTGSIFYLKNAQHRLAMIFLPLTALRVVVVIPAAYLGAEVGVAAGILGCTLLNFLIWHGQTARLLGTRLSTHVAVLGRSAVSAGAMAAVVVAVQLAVPAPATTLLAIGELVLLAGIGAAAHVGVQVLLWRRAGMPDGPERQVLDAALGLLARWRGGRRSSP